MHTYPAWRLWLVFVVLLMLLGMVVRLRFTELVRWALYG